MAMAVQRLFKGVQVGGAVSGRVPGLRGCRRCGTAGPAQHAWATSSRLEAYRVPFVGKDEAMGGGLAVGLCLCLTAAAAVKAAMQTSCLTVRSVGTVAQPSEGAWRPLGVTL